MRTILLASCALLLSAFAARAASVDDVIAMAQKGEPEDKQVAAVESAPGEFNVGAADVLRLRESKVPEKVILAMLRHVSQGEKVASAAPIAPPSAPNSPAVAAVPQPQVQQRPNNAVAQAPSRPIQAAPPIQPAAPSVVRNPNQDGTLTIENLDDRAWSYMYEPAVQTIWIGFASQGSPIGSHSGTTLSIHAGHYKVKFSGTQVEGFPLTVSGGDRSALNISRTAEAGIESVNVSIYENNERKFSGKLANLANPLPPNGAVGERQVVERQVVEGPTTYYYNSPPPVYYNNGPYYYSPGYYRPYYGSQFNLGFNFGGGGGRRR